MALSAHSVVRAQAQDTTPPLDPSCQRCGAALPVSPHAYLRDREIARQTLRIDDLRGSRRRWQPAAITFGVGIASLAIGAILMRRSWTDDPDGYGYKPAMEGAAVVMLPLGALTMLVAGPLFGVRASRTLRLARAERALLAATSKVPSP